MVVVLFLGRDWFVGLAWLGLAWLGLSWHCTFSSNCFHNGNYQKYFLCCEKSNVKRFVSFLSCFLGTVITIIFSCLPFRSLVNELIIIIIIIILIIIIIIIII
jgi:hypothetical protein